MKKLILSCALFLPLLMQHHAAAKQIDTAHQVTSYLLFDDQSFDYIENTLIPAIQKKEIHTDRLMLSFLDPNMNIQKIKEDTTTKNLDQLLVDAGLVSHATVGAGKRLQQDIAELNKAGVQVFFAIGGWAYSCHNPQKQNPSCTSNFPLTQDIHQHFQSAKLSVNKLEHIQKTEGYSSKELTDTWVNVAQTMGASGVDLDYEENWFAAETTYYYAPKTINPDWARDPDGPYVLPYSVIKYATYIKSLTDSAKSVNLKVTAATPAAGAFNVHDWIGGSDFWCPVSDQWGNKLCGDGRPSTDQKNFTVGGNLKGVFYDMANYEKINKQEYRGKKYPFVYEDKIFKNLFSGLDAINVMTYDLDDGHDGINASWCIGRKDNHPQGHFTSRDPNTDGYKNVDCSITSQTKAIIEMYKENVINKIASGNKPHLGFGLEAGFPNYPINIDPDLPGGGNSETAQADPHFRWNDPFIIAGLPLQKLETSLIEKWKGMHHSETNQHTGLLIVDQALFQKMHNAGADGVILWSLNNADHNEHFGKSSWDYQQFRDGKNVFGVNHDPVLLKAVFENAAGPEDILQVANGFYHLNQ